MPLILCARDCYVSSLRQSCLVDPSVSNRYLQKRMFTRSYLLVCAPCIFSLSARGKKVAVGGCWREESGGNERGEQCRTQASREDLARWAGRSGALQTNNLEHLNPVKRRTSPPPLLSRPSSQRDLPYRRDDLAGSGVTSWRSRKRGSTKARNRRKLSCRGHVAFSPGVIDCPYLGAPRGRGPSGSIASRHKL